jgi:histidyl-tRNA synthetase
MIDPRVASGLRDILPSEMIARERMLAAFRQTFASFGYVPIDTPHIERMEVLTGKGAGSDEVLRQIFEVTNKGGKPGELALRFDLTVPLARFVAKHLNELGLPFKRYAIGSVFRGERPAKGRFREFMQCDFDTVGTISSIADVETIQVIYEALTAVGVPAFTITLSDRRILDGLLDIFGVVDKSGPVLRALDKLAKVGSEKVRAELQPLLPEFLVQKIFTIIEHGRGGPEVLDRANTEVYSQTGNSNSQSGINRLRRILELLDAAGVPQDRLKIDLGLTRGLDYYTGIVFETTVNGWEQYGSVSSGGRYGNLWRLFTDRPLSGVGGSIGLDRLLAVMRETGWRQGTSTMVPVLVARFQEVDEGIPVKLGARLRGAGVGAEVFPDAYPLGLQMSYGSSRGHKLGVIVGPDEVGREVFNLRDLATRQEQKAIPWAELEPAVKRALGMEP